MPKIGPWTLEEIAPPRVSFQRDGSASGTREFKTATWSEGREIARWLLPGAAVPLRGGIIVRPGASFPGIPELLVNAVEVAPFDDEYPADEDDFDVATCPSGCKLTVEYSTLAVDEGQTQEGGSGQVTLSLEVAAAGEVLTVKPSTCKWESDGTVNQTDDLNANQLIGGFEYTITLDHCPVLPLAQWQAMVGKISSTTMPYLGNAAAETVLFQGAQAEKTVSIPADDGTPAGFWKIRLNFAQRVIHDGDEVRGWNHLYRPRHGWDRVLLDDGSYLYQTADLNALLIPPVA